MGTDGAIRRVPVDGGRRGTYDVSRPVISPQGFVLLESILNTTVVASIVTPLQGFSCSQPFTQGVALGWLIAGLWPLGSLAAGGWASGWLGAGGLASGWLGASGLA